MPIASDVIQQKRLDLIFRNVGTAPASLELALFAGDPSDGGTELTSDGGYARVTINAADWSSGTDGSVIAGPIAFADATDAWSDTATHWCLIEGSDLGECGSLTDPITIAGPTTDITLESITVFYADTVTPDDSDS